MAGRYLATKNVVVIGSTGSIGQSTLSVVDNLNNDFRIVGLAVKRNARLLARQIKHYKPEAAAIYEEEAGKYLTNSLKSFQARVKIFAGREGLCKLAALPSADVVVFGMSGAEALTPLLAAIRAGKKIALANKEAVIIAGELLLKEAGKHGAEIIPVDSEHSAIFQCLNSGKSRSVKRLILTASGGPFYKTKTNLADVTVQEVLAHPVWRMGAKITVDSATLMNKGLEAIEAHHLFQVPMDKISVIIHPQSIVHSIVEFEDGAMLAQLSTPDMRLPIQYALTYPERIKSCVPPLHLDKIAKLEFSAPDFSRFPCLKLAFEAGRTGGTMPAVLNAANEEAVNAFLKGKLGFLQIYKVVKAVMSSHKPKPSPSLEDILKADSWSRTQAAKLL